MTYLCCDSIFILFWIQIGTASVTVVGSIKLIDAGYTTVTLALLMAVIVPLNFIFIFISNRSLVGEKCLSTSINLTFHRRVQKNTLREKIYNAYLHNIYIGFVFSKLNNNVPNFQHYSRSISDYFNLFYSWVQERWRNTMVVFDFNICHILRSPG